MSKFITKTAAQALFIKRTGLTLHSFEKWLKKHRSELKQALPNNKEQGDWYRDGQKVFFNQKSIETLLKQTT
jgi:hypothetical protein